MVCIASFKRAVAVSLIPNLLSAGCNSTRVLHPEGYTSHGDQEAQVVLKKDRRNGLVYRIESPWEADSLYNISGKGRLIMQDGTKVRDFEGTIGAGEIASVKIIESDPVGTLLLIGGVGLLIVLIGVYSQPIDVSLSDRP